MLTERDADAPFLAPNDGAWTVNIVRCDNQREFIRNEER